MPTPPEHRRGRRPRIPADVESGCRSTTRPPGPPSSRLSAATSVQTPVGNSRAAAMAAVSLSACSIALISEYPSVSIARDSPRRRLACTNETPSCVPNTLVAAARSSRRHSTSSLARTVAVGADAASIESSPKTSPRPADRRAGRPHGPRRGPRGSHRGGWTVPHPVGGWWYQPDSALREQPRRARAVVSHRPCRRGAPRGAERMSPRHHSLLHG